MLQGCLLLLNTRILVTHFPKQLSVGLITAVHKSGDKLDVSNQRGITVRSGC